MSKELTEQWQNGTLPQGYYYIIANTEQKHKVIFYLPERNTEDEAHLDLKDQFVLEVLALVPRYKEWKQLKDLLKEYKKQLSEIKNAYIDLTTQDEYGSYYIDEAKLFVEIVGKITKDYGELELKHDDVLKCQD